MTVGIRITGNTIEYVSIRMGIFIFIVVPCILLQFTFISPTHAHANHTVLVLIYLLLQNKSQTKYDMLPAYFKKTVMDNK